ncbi:MAG TPA: magnesium/cobalt transporter CorA [Abditibacteriaceae bacterium]|jgi:magnesium transporter
MNRDELLNCAPSEHETTRTNQERGDNSGLLAHAAPRCRPGEFIWIDITAPDEEDFTLVQERFGVNQFVIEDIHSAEGRPKLHDYEEQLYLVFHTVEFSKTVDSPTEDKAPFAFELQEIDCLIGHDYVLTIHAKEVPCFEDLRKRWKRSPTLMQNGPAYLLYEVMDEVLDDYFPLLDKVDDHIDDLEERMLEGRGSNLSAEIFALKRTLLKIRHIAGPTRDVVNTLLRRDAENGARHFAYFQDLYDHAVRIVDTVDTFRDILGGAMDVYLASQGNRLNEVMKTMTATSILLLVPNLIAAIYGMNFKHMPETETKYGYFIVLGLMAAVGLSLFAYFKKIEWI